MSNVAKGFNLLMFMAGTYCIAYPFIARFMFYTSTVSYKSHTMEVFMLIYIGIAILLLQDLGLIIYCTMKKKK